MIENLPQKDKEPWSRLVRTVSIFGLTESAVAGQLTQFKKRFPQFKVDFSAKFPENYVKLYTDQPNVAQLKKTAAEATAWICRKLGNHVFSVSGQSMEQIVGKLLQKNQATLAVAESCTGGLIANLLTDVPGSSEYFLFSAVTYSNSAKMKVLGVKNETLDGHGAVSEQTAAEMARSARSSVDATFGLATSGIAGPGGGTEDKPVGTVCVGLATPSCATGHRFYFPNDNRLVNKHIFAVAALNLLRVELLRAIQPHLTDE